MSFWSGWHKLSTLDKSYKWGKFGCLSRKTLLCLSCGGNSFKWRKFCRNSPSRSAEGGEFNGRFKNDRLTIEMDSGIKFSFNFNKKYCSMFGYQLTIIVLTVWAISVKITRWISFTVKEVDRSTSSKRGECPRFADERCFCFLILFFVCLWVYEYCLWVRKEIKFGYSCFLGKILHSWYRQSSFLHSATPRARDGLSVSRVQDFAEKALVPKLDSYNNANFLLKSD